MRGVIALGLFSMLLFLIAGIIMIVGGQNKSKKTIRTIISCFAGSVILGSFSIYGLLLEVDDLLPERFTLRTGDEIYEHYYGRPKYSCLQVIDHVDSESPEVQRGDWLHFKTCPKEFKRIIRQYNFGVKTDSANGVWSGKPYLENDWFKPDKLGKGRLKFSFPDEPEPRLIIYTNPDSTEVYMVSFN